MSKKFDIDYWLTEDGKCLLQVWAKDGLTNDRIARQMGCSRSTFKKYLAEYPELKQSLDKWKEEPDKKVEVSLYERCFGKFVEVEKSYKLKKPKLNADGEIMTDSKGSAIYEDVIETKTEREFIPPDFKAQAMWLRNRLPKNWSLEHQKLEYQRQKDAAMQKNIEDGKVKTVVISIEGGENGDLDG